VLSRPSIKKTQHDKYKEREEKQQDKLTTFVKKGENIT
jgi:hypothetical protein